MPTRAAARTANAPSATPVRSAPHTASFSTDAASGPVVLLGPHQPPAASKDPVLQRPPTTIPGRREGIDDLPARAQQRSQRDVDEPRERHQRDNDEAREDVELDQVRH